MFRNEMSVKELLSQLEEEIRIISVEHHTGGYKNQQEALLTVKELQLKLFAIHNISQQRELLTDKNKGNI